MTKRGMKTMALVTLLFAGAWHSHAQTGPSVKPTSLSFAYQLNSTTLPASVKIVITLPIAIATLPIKVSTDHDWLIATPSQGYTPLSCTVSVNVYGLTPGTYPAIVTVDTVPTHGALSVPVVLSISNPAASLLLTSPSPYFAKATSAQIAAMSFSYVTSMSVTPAQIELDVASTGDSIPFDVTATSGSGATAGWLRVSLYQTIPPAPVLHTSATVLLGGQVLLYVSVDPTLVALLDVGSYAGQINVVDSNNAKDAKSVLVSLVITAGMPSLRKTDSSNPPHPISPYTLVAAPTLDPVITIYGDNFFLTSVVNVGNATTAALPVKGQSLLSRQVLQVTLPKDYFAPAADQVWPWLWTLTVTNPDQPPVSTTLTVTDPNLPSISAVVNAASFQQAAAQTGSNPDPVTGAVPTAVCPLEIISIFGQNLGPADVTATTPAGTPPTFPQTGAGPNGGSVRVKFHVPGPTVFTTFDVFGPIIMTSNNQINAIVPQRVATLIGKALHTVYISVVSTPNGLPSLTSSPAWPALVLPEDPGQFTFGGLGQGQAAVLNYDSTGASSINSSKNGALRGQPISIYATGMGNLASGDVIDGVVATTADRLADDLTRVEIDGQPVVVTYAGTSPGSVPGLTQINAIVPPTVAAGKALPVTVSIGDITTRRRSQLNVIIYIGK